MLPVVAAVLLLASSVLTGPAADADQFQPSGDPPTVSTPSLTVQAGDGSLTGTAVEALQPAWETSTEKYHATVTIGAPSLTESLESVTLCLYQPSVHDPATDCDAAGYVPTTADEPDPTTLFVMVWDRTSADTGADGTFSVVGTNDYGETGSISGWNDGSAISLDLSFGFTVSNAMRKGSDWVARVEAVDSGDRTAEAARENVNVAYFEHIVAQRAAVDYGVLAVGAASVQEDLDTGEYSANSRAQLSIDSTSVMFVEAADGAPEIELPKVARGVGGAPSAGEVAVDCHAAGTFDAGGTLVRLDGTGQQTLFTSIDRTGEAAADLPDHSCRATYGGGIDRANFTLESTVTVALSESAPVPSNVAATTSETSRTVTWDAPAGAGSDFTVESYVIEGSTDDGTTFSPLRRVTSDDGTEFTDREVTITGLERDSVYTLRVTANTTVGAGSATGDADPQVPTVPRGVSADAQSAQIVVSWQEPVGDGGSAVTGYTVRGYTGASFDTLATTQTVGDDATSATFALGGGTGQIAAGTDYRFTVAASNAEGEGAATPQSEIASVEIIEQTFSAGSGRTGAFQTYTVASTGTYNLLVEGAQGGGTYGGRGAVIDADVSLQSGDVLTILVGHRGQSSSSGGSGGGGASAVWVSRGGSTTLVAIAGGGGGVYNASSFRSSADASTSTTANGGYASPAWRTASGGSGGQSGGGTSGTGGAGGGGGIGTGRASGSTDSRNADRITSTSAAGANATSDGGFGGGGGANNNGTSYLGGGGGGGYSGGGGSSSAGGAASHGGGGGSYVNPDYTVGSNSKYTGSNGNTGAGSVTISG